MRNQFKPFSLKSAFTIEESSTTSPETIINNEAPPIYTPPIEVVEIIETSCGSTCKCKRCSGNYMTMTPYERLDRKLNWILTLIIFMFIVLVIHVRSQTSKKM
jgi:hypothetical protein